MSESDVRLGAAQSDARACAYPDGSGVAIADENRRSGALHFIASVYATIDGGGVVVMCFALEIQNLCGRKQKCDEKSDFEKKNVTRKYDQKARTSQPNTSQYTNP